MWLLHHGADCDGQIVGIAIDQRTYACIHHVLIEAGRPQADDQSGQMGLMTTHAFQELERYFEGIRRTRRRLKLIDTHKITLSLLRSDPTIKQLTEFE